MRRKEAETQGGTYEEKALQRGEPATSAGLVEMECPSVVCAGDGRGNVLLGLLAGAGAAGRSPPSLGLPPLGTPLTSPGARAGCAACSVRPLGRLGQYWPDTTTMLALLPGPLFSPPPLSCQPAPAPSLLPTLPSEPSTWVPAPCSCRAISPGMAMTCPPLSPNGSMLLLLLVLVGRLGGCSPPPSPSRL
eukprot:1134426-Pelagomonas_calceolata.AAC.1